MSVGDKIRRIRKLYGITQVELAEATGMDDSTIRKYESGRVIPKPVTIAKIASGLGVSPEAITDDTPDSEAAMRRLFALFQSYEGRLKKGDEIRDDKIYISFDSLQPFMRSWYDEYVKYIESLKRIEEQPDGPDKEQALSFAEYHFQDWMLKYPDYDPQYNMLQFYKIMDEAQEYMSSHPLNDPDNPVSPEEKERIYAELRKIYKKLDNSAAASFLKKYDE